MSAITANVSVAPSFGARALSAFGRVCDALASASHANRCRIEAERLLSMTDEQLAARGLAREDVVTHAFRRYLSI